MPTFKLTIAYDGTGFVGWQRQASGISIQGLLEDALRELDGRDVEVAGAGRTDAGVHALGQVASVSLERAIDRLDTRARPERPIAGECPRASMPPTRLRAFTRGSTRDRKPIVTASGTAK